MVRRFCQTALLLFVTACAPIDGNSERSTAMGPIKQLERQSGGRLGVALIDAKGRPLLTYRSDERFAMCSTFKTLLAAQMLDAVSIGNFGLDDPIVFTRADLVNYAPVMEKLLGDKGQAQTNFVEAAKAAVTVSDNVAANLLLERMNGPDGLTSWLRANGDNVTRLDRNEPTLNQNISGDPRDTTSPAAMAQSVRKVTLEDVLSPTSRELLTRWLMESTTGKARIRAGLPENWLVGDKTGTCGYHANGAANDVALIVRDDDAAFVLAVYLDRAQGTPEEINAIIAAVARIAANEIDR